MSLTPCIHLSFNGQCEAAFKHYERSLGGTIESLFRYGGSPAAAEAPPGWDAKIMHAAISIGGTLIMGSDVSPDRYERPQGFQVLLQLHDAAEAERVFAALAENGTVDMPLQKTFWAERFGVVRDQFGIPWSINCDAATQSVA